MDKQGRLRVEEFLPQQVLQRLLCGDIPVAPSTDKVESVVLFLDLSGFTKLTEQLGQQGERGLEKMAFFLNRYFEQIVKLLGKSGGDIFKFAGDAILALWIDEAPESPTNNDENKQEQEDSIHLARTAKLAHRAAQCAFELQDVLNEAVLADGVAFSIKIGMGIGETSILHVGGTYNRFEYLVAGPALGDAISCEGHCSPGDVVVSKRFWRLLETRGSPFEGQEIRPSASEKLGLEAKSFVRLKKMRERVKDVSTKRGGELLSSDALQNVLSRYAPASIKQYMKAYGGWLPELRTVSVIFLNLGLAGSMFENDVPIENVQLLQDVFQIVQRETYRHEGSINKFLLDDKGSTALIAFGLPPLSHANDAARAVSSCLDIVVALKSKLQYKNRCYMGITTGKVFCGPIGGGARREYTVLGDLVNTAARLMQSAKQHSNNLVQTEVYCGYILCDKTTRERVEGKTFPRSTDICFRMAGNLKLKGKVEPLQVFQPGWKQLQDQGRIMSVSVPMGTGALTTMKEDVSRALESRSMDLLLAFDRFSVSRTRSSAILFALNDPGPVGSIVLDSFCRALREDNDLDSLPQHEQRYANVWMKRNDKNKPNIKQGMTTRNLHQQLKRGHTVKSLDLIDKKTGPAVLIRLGAFMSRTSFPLATVWGRILATVISACSLGESTQNELHQHAYFAGGLLDRNIIVDYESLAQDCSTKLQDREASIQFGYEVMQRAVEKLSSSKLGSIVVCIENAEHLHPQEWEFCQALLDHVPSGLGIVVSSLPLHSRAFWPSFSKGPCLAYCDLLWRANSFTVSLENLHVTRVEQVIMSILRCTSVSDTLLECVWLLTGGKANLLSICTELLCASHRVCVTSEGVADWQDYVDFDGLLQEFQTRVAEELVFPVPFDKLSVPEQVFLKSAAILARGGGVFTLWFDFGTLVVVAENLLRKGLELPLPEEKLSQNDFFAKATATTDIVEEFKTVATKLQRDGLIQVPFNQETLLQDCPSVALTTEDDSTVTRQLFCFPNVAVREALFERVLYSRRKQIHSATAKTLKAYIELGEKCDPETIRPFVDAARRTLVFHLLSSDELDEANKVQRELRKSERAARETLSNSSPTGAGDNSLSTSFKLRKKSSLSLFQMPGTQLDKAALGRGSRASFARASDAPSAANRAVFRRSLAAIAVFSKATGTVDQNQHLAEILASIDAERDAHLPATSGDGILGALKKCVTDLAETAARYLPWKKTTSKVHRYQIEPATKNGKSASSVLDEAGEKELGFGTMTFSQRSANTLQTVKMFMGRNDFENYEAEHIAAHFAHSTRFSSLSEDDMMRVVDEFDSWDFNVFQFGIISNGMPLFAVMQLVLAQFPELRDKVDMIQLTKLLHKVDKGHNARNPFHNSTYATSLIHACYCLMSLTKVSFPEAQVLALFIAAAISCYGHPGLQGVGHSDWGGKKIFKRFKESLALTFEVFGEEDRDKALELIQKLLNFQENITSESSRASDVDVLSLIFACANFSAATKNIQQHLEWARRFSQELDLDSQVIKVEAFQKGFLFDAEPFYGQLGAQFPSCMPLWHALHRNLEFSRHLVPPSL